MKMLKTVEFPLDLILQGLKSSEPKYIIADDARISLYDVAASLIISLLSRVDDADLEKQKAYALLEKLLPNPPHWAEQQCTGKSEQAFHHDTQRSAAGAVSTATVIAAIIKQAAI